MTRHAELANAGHDELSGRAYASRVAGFGVVALVTLATVVGLVAVGQDDFTQVDWQVLFTLAAAALFTLTGLQGVRLARRADDPVAFVGWLAILASAVSLAMALVVIWSPDYFEGSDDALWRAVLIGIAWSIALAHASALFGGRRGSDRVAVKALAATAMGFTTGIASLLTFLLIETQIDPGEGFWQAISAMAIVAGAATILVPVVRRLGMAR